MSDWNGFVLNTQYKITNHYYRKQLNAIPYAKSIRFGAKQDIFLSTYLQKNWVEKAKDFWSFSWIRNTSVSNPPRNKNAFSGWLWMGSLLLLGTGAIVLNPNKAAKRIVQPSLHNPSPKPISTLNVAQKPQNQRFHTAHTGRTTIVRTTTSHHSNTGNTNVVITPAKSPAIPISWKTLEQNSQLLTNLKSSLTTKELGSGQDAYCYALGNDFVLRANRIYGGKSAPITDDLVCLPIQYPDSTLAENPQLGLPIAALIDEASVNGRTHLEPKDLEAKPLYDPSKVNHTILRRVNGENIEKLGCPYDLARPLAQSNIMDTFKEDLGAEMYKQSEIDIPKAKKDLLAKISTTPNSDKFIRDYNLFTKQYINYLQKISKIPQVAFDDALVSLKQLKTAGIDLDFQMGRNFFYNQSTQRFEFIDLEMNPASKFLFRGNEPALFFEALLGRFACGYGHSGFTRRLSHLLVRDADRVQLNPCIKEILEKMDKASKQANIKWNEKHLINFKEANIKEVFKTEGIQL